MHSGPRIPTDPVPEEKHEAYSVFYRYEGKWYRRTFVLEDSARDYFARVEDMYPAVLVEHESLPAYPARLSNDPSKIPGEHRILAGSQDF